MSLTEKLKPRGRPFAPGLDARRAKGRPAGLSNTAARLRNSIPKMMEKIIEQGLQGNPESVLVCVEIFGMEKTRRLFLKGIEGGDSGNGQGDKQDPDSIQNATKGTKKKPIEASVEG